MTFSYSRVYLYNNFKCSKSNFRFWHIFLIENSQTCYKLWPAWEIFCVKDISKSKTIKTTFERLWRSMAKVVWKIHTWNKDHSHMVWVYMFAWGIVEIMVMGYWPLGYWVMGVQLSFAFSVFLCYFWPRVYSQGPSSVFGHHSHLSIFLSFTQIYGYIYI